MAGWASTKSGRRILKAATGARQPTTDERPRALSRAMQGATFDATAPAVNRRLNRDVEALGSFARVMTRTSSRAPPPGDLDLDRDQVHVWHIALNWPAWLAEARLGTLDAVERDRAARFASAPDRRRFVLTRGALRAILGRYLHVQPDAVEISVGHHGKPILADDSTGLRFNVAHSGDLALIAVARGRAIGIDVERITSDPGATRVAERFFSRAEAAALRSLPPGRRIAGFFNCWTRKEAYIKARGEGLALPLDQFDVSLAPGEPAALLATRDDPAEATRWSLRALEPGPGYAAALAVEGHGWRLTCWTSDAPDPGIP